jgi:outer membrane protein assembly factor BamB
MKSWLKVLMAWLILLLAISSALSLFSKVTATQINPTYGGTKNNGDQLDIKFSEPNGSTIYLAEENWINFSVGFGRYSFDYQSFGAFFNSVSYKASWLNGPVMVYDWSYHDPANLKDDDPNPQTGFQGAIALSNAPLGNQQITVNALAGDYATDFRTYCIMTANNSLTLNFTISAQREKTPIPTYNSESGILWRTNIPWNLTGTPAQKLWETNIVGKDRAWTNPVIVNGIVYAGATSSVGLNQYGTPQITWIDIYAFNAENGKQIWDYQTVFSSITSLAVADGIVYFGAEGDFFSVQDDKASDCLNALDATNGNLLWTTPCSVFYSTPVTEEGKVLINSGHSLLAFNAFKGNIIWNYTTDDIICSSPVVANGIAYIASYDHSLNALNIDTGKKIWNYTTKAGFSSGGLVANGVLYAPSGDGNVYALNALTGKKLWSCNTTPPEFSSWVNDTSPSTPVYYNGKLYLTSSSDQHIHLPNSCKMLVKTSVLALDSSGGRKMWNFTVDNCAIDGYVTVAEGVVYNQVSGSIVGFNSQTGAIIWNFTNGDLYPESQPIIANGVLYIGYNDGQIYALKAPLAPLAVALSIPTTISFTILGVILSAAVIIVAIILVLHIRKIRL